ncbi:Mitogen-activated protein kinase 6 like protein [Argiope bruennichi]|uniref:non-specific serine/threonine protein kinase n=1 Tax=Argiope bruennichi TaxID=94029 RepID=A0A8T0EWQ4_ARGBR|nr:Mitogen-activated protein kinase 6 like protein [Argiope bruennichi]
MDKTVFKASEIRYLWKHRGSKNYELKCLKATGNFITNIIFEDVRNGREVSGKLVASPREGEAYHWPRLQHENLAPLFDVVSISEKVSVYMSIVLEKSLRDIIHEDEFLRAPNCFERKKSYAEDVLWGLDYLHDKRLCLMNLNDANVFIYSQTDKAVIGDFSCLTLAARAMKCNVAVPSLYRAPELSDSSNNFNAIAAEMWACGVMMLQIFTGHAMPETCSNDELLQRVANLHYGILIEANRGSFITSNAFISFQNFLSLFLCLDPKSRCTAKIAAVSSFLQRSWSRTDRRFGKLWQFYVPQTIYSPEEDEFENKSLCDSSKVLLRSNEIDSYRDNLKMHFPWNKFINLNYVSNEQNSSRSGMFHNSLQSNKQNNQEILNNETFDKQIKKEKVWNFENKVMEQYIQETNQAGKQSFEDTNNTPEIVKNNFCSEIDRNKHKLNNAMHLSNSSDIPDSSNNNDNLPVKEISDNESKHTEMQNENAAINCDSFTDITPNEEFWEIQKNDAKEIDKLSSNLEYSTGDCIGMFQNEEKEKQNEKSFLNDESPESIISVRNNANIIEKYILKAKTNKLSTSSSFSSGDSIVTARNEIRMDNKEINYNLLPEIKKSNWESDEGNERCESDFEMESSNQNLSDSSWIKGSFNQISLSNTENHGTGAHYLLDPGINKITRFKFYKNRNTEFRRSHSDSTINLSISHCISAKSDPGLNQYQMSFSDRSWYSHITVSSDASNAFLINSTEKDSERSYCVMNRDKNINEEAGIEPFSFSEGYSFSCNESELSDTLQKAENSETNNSLTEDTYSPLKRGLLLSAKSLTYHPGFLSDINVGLSFLSNKSDSYLGQRNSSLSISYKMCSDVQKRRAMSQTESLNKDAKFYHGDTLTFNPEKFDIEKGSKNGEIKIGNTSESKNAESLGNKTDIFKCNKMNSSVCAITERLDLNTKCEISGYFPNEDIPLPDGTTENESIPLEAKLIKMEDMEYEKSESDFQSIKDVLLKYEEINNEQTNEDFSKNLGLDKDNEMNETLVESSSFTEISLNSTQEPDNKPEKNKKKKRRKSWFHRLCPGCKVYYDDKEELFAGT